MRLAAVLLCAAGFALPLGAAAQATKFDGAWKVSVNCPGRTDIEGAKGYTVKFSAEVANGQFRGVYGTEGEPGWIQLQGPIGADGTATLKAEGLVNNTEVAGRNSSQGKVYNYLVKAQFEADAGTGQRLTGRTCDFKFLR